MAYCPNCGSEVDAAVVLAAAAVGSQSSDEVEMTRINREADIEIARINAGAVRAESATEIAVAEIDADAEVEVAAANAEIIGAAIESAGGPDETAPDESAGEPIVIADPAPDPAESLAPPEVESHRESKPSSPFAWNYS
jgi:hypothetical protein